MTTLANRERTALIVIDVQNGVVDGAHERDRVVETIAALVERARGEGVPVVWVQHSDDELLIDSDPWHLVPDLAPLPTEPLIHKRYGDAFEGTELEEVLASLRVGRLVVTGAQSDACIRSTLHGAFTRGYDVTLVEDAHTAVDLSEYGAPAPALVVSHTNLYWSFQAAPGRRAETVPAAEVDFAGSDVPA